MHNPSQHQTGTLSGLSKWLNRANNIYNQTVQMVGFQLARDINNVRDYTVWSVFNICCCFLALGACALYMSSKTKNYKHMSNLQGAREASRWAAILNNNRHCCWYHYYYYFHSSIY